MHGDVSLSSWTNLGNRPALKRAIRTGIAVKQVSRVLRDLAIDRAPLVWSTDITYVRMRRGFLYLVAIQDWYSRYVLSWELSNTLDGAFCLLALESSTPIKEHSSPVWRLPEY